LDCIAKSGSVYNFFSFQFQIANDTVLKSPSFALKDGTLCDDFGQLPEFSILDFWPKYCRVFGGHGSLCYHSSVTPLADGWLMA
jgi:hypothetical protein